MDIARRLPQWYLNAETLHEVEERGGGGSKGFHRASAFASSGRCCMHIHCAGASRLVHTLQIMYSPDKSARPPSSNGACVIGTPRTT